MTPFLGHSEPLWRSFPKLYPIWVGITSAFLVVFCAGEVSASPRVCVAASLNQAVQQAAQEYEDTTGTHIEVLADGSSRLARQIESGLVCDVFIAANLEWLSYVTESQPPRLGPSIVARNRLVLASVAELKWKDIESIKEVAGADRNVPAGTYALAALEGLSVSPVLVHLGNASQAAAAVKAGSVAAGLVYESDAILFRLPYDPIPQEAYPPISYWGALLTDNPEAAQFFSHLEGGLDLNQGGVPTELLDVWGAVFRSVWVALLALLLGILPAVFAGHLLARRQFFGKSVLVTMLYAPLVLPPVITGLLLLWVLGPQGLGLGLEFTKWGAVLAALVVGFPLFVASSRGAFEVVDVEYEKVGRTLGWSEWEVFRRVTLPLALPGVAAGAVLAFARALGEFGATIILAANISGETQTISLAVYSLLQSPDGGDGLHLLVGMSIFLSFVALAGYEMLNRWQRERLELDRD